MQHQPCFKIPPACLTVFVKIFMLTTIVIYNLFFVPFVSKYTKKKKHTHTHKGKTLLQRMGVDLVLHIIIMITAFSAERRRPSVAREHGIYGEKEIAPLSIFILFYDQASEGTKSFGTVYFTTSMGDGFFLTSFLLSTVADITNKYRKGWILDNLNISLGLLLCMPFMQ